MNFAQRHTEILRKVKQACERAGRETNSVHILAVSKTQPIEAIEEAYAAGVRHFGENYVQELVEKKKLLSHLKDICWHLIGPLQSNKAAIAIKSFNYFHALDSEKLLTTISKKAKAENLKEKLSVFVQVNVDDEETKSGVSAGELQALCQKVLLTDNILLMGLMCIPMPASDPTQMRQAFKRLAALSLELQCNLPLKQPLQLSMGMSEDFEVAIEEGAHWVRIGRALFGERRKKH